jgi:RNA ligase (TIGR02306 family)
MSSSLVVPVVVIENVRPHPNADKLDLCDVLGYQMCIGRGKYKTGDKGVYVPADSLVPAEWGDKWGVREYLKGKDKDRVGRVRLRGEPSFGLIVDTEWLPPAGAWYVGANVADVFGITKYEPPIKATAGDAAAYDSEIDPYLARYTDIENGRIFVDVFKDGEQVTASEKLHGTNCKVALFKVGEEWKMVAGSMSYRRKPPVDGEGREDPSQFANSVYWHPWSLDAVRTLFRLVLARATKSVILYGEIYGGSVQNLAYGIPKGKGVAFRAFDLSIDDKYMNWEDFIAVCSMCGVPTVPELYRGPYSMAKMKELADGKSTMPGADNIREGVVVKPLVERVDSKVGRAVLKFIGTEYELSKRDGDDSKDA